MQTHSSIINLFPRKNAVNYFNWARRIASQINNLHTFVHVQLFNFSLWSNSFYAGILQIKRCERKSVSFKWVCVAFVVGGFCAASSSFRTNDNSIAGSTKRKECYARKHLILTAKRIWCTLYLPLCFNGRNIPNLNRFAISSLYLLIATFDSFRKAITSKKATLAAMLGGTNSICICSHKLSIFRYCCKFEYRT